MAQYIDKAAVVAKIKKSQKEEVFYDEDGSFASWADQYHYSILKSIKNFLDTLKVKEEVTTTDAFIEKAWNWIEDNMLSSNQQDKSRLYYKQFANYIKGE